MAKQVSVQFVPKGASNLLNIFDDIDRKLKLMKENAAGAGKIASQSFDELQKDMLAAGIAVQNIQRKFVKGVVTAGDVRDLETRLETIGDIMADVVQKVAADPDKMNKMVSQWQNLFVAIAHLKGVQRDLEDFSGALQNMEEVMGGLRSAFGDIRGKAPLQAYKNFNKVFKSLGKGLKNMGKQIQGASSRTSILGSGLSSLGGALASSAVPLAAFGTVAAGAVFAWAKGVEYLADWNKEILEATGGVSGLLRSSGRASTMLEASGTDIRESFYDSGKALTESVMRMGYVNEKELMKFSGVLATAGVEAGHFTTSADQTQKSFLALAGIASSFGISQEEAARLMGESMAGLGLKIEGVQKRYALLDKVSTQSGLSQSRFLSLVNQATSDFGIFDMRVSSAGEAIAAFTKAFGEREGSKLTAELLKTHKLGIDEARAFVYRLSSMSLAGQQELEKLAKASMEELSKRLGEQMEGVAVWTPAIREVISVLNKQGANAGDVLKTISQLGPEAWEDMNKVLRQQAPQAQLLLTQMKRMGDAFQDGGVSAEKMAYMISTGIVPPAAMLEAQLAMAGTTLKKFAELEPAGKEFQVLAAKTQLPVELLVKLQADAAARIAAGAESLVEEMKPITAVTAEEIGKLREGTEKAMLETTTLIGRTWTRAASSVKDGLLDASANLSHAGDYIEKSWDRIAGALQKTTPMAGTTINQTINVTTVGSLSSPEELATVIRRAAHDASK